MRQQVKRGLLVLFGACVILAYGVYWWHQVSLDRQVAQDQVPEELVAEAAAIRQGFDPAAATTLPVALKRLEKLADEDRASVLVVLAQDPDVAVRMAILPYLRKDRMHPRVRAALARMARDDEDKVVRETASDALAGRAP
jgi:hypothetical protein